MTKLVIKQLFIHEENNKSTHLIGDVINYNGSLGTSVVHGGQTVVALLSGCVPNLKLYRCVIQAHRLRKEGRWKQKSKVGENMCEQVQANLDTKIPYLLLCFLETRETAP